MEHLFFNLDGGFTEVVRRVFASIGTVVYKEGDSVNVLGGAYSVISVFGVAIKIEPNSYDYEDDYDYMISVRKDVLTQLKVDASVIEALSRIVARMLADNESIQVAREATDGLEIVYPGET